jgi:DNA primase
MILHPEFFRKLEEGGIRDCLAGSVGEVLFLQLRHLLEQRDEVEPEELLSVLPEGAERTLVAELLIDAPGAGGADIAMIGGDEEAGELLEWLKLYALQRASEQVLLQIQRVQSSGDFVKLQTLLREKQKIDRELQGLEN